MKIKLFGKTINVSLENTNEKRINEKPINQYVKLFPKSWYDKPDISMYELNKLFPKSWKNNEHYKKKIWKQQNISWHNWRSNQAELALNYYLQNRFSISKKDVSDKFGISFNAFYQAWRSYKSENKLSEVLKNV